MGGNLNFFTHTAKALIKGSILIWRESTLFLFVLSCHGLHAISRFFHVVALFSPIRQCMRCILPKTRPVPAAELVNITSSYPLELVCIDYLKLETSKGGYEDVLVITGHFTRYAKAIPTRNQRSRTITRAEHFFVHYGFPPRLHSDKAESF